MCLKTKWSKVRRDKWLAKKPKIIIGYKVVAIWPSDGRQGDKGLYPPICGHEFSKYKSDAFYDQTNRLKVKNFKEIISTITTGQQYIPYFHICLTMEGAEYWLNELRYKKVIIVSCEIPKKLITEVGTQRGYTTIVTKGFTIIGRGSYFEGRK